jgi:hypothetical protein
MQKPPPGELVLDHVAHFVPELGAARELLSALGFTPTPISNHEVRGAPAGTSNCCLMFERGYVEILSPTLDTPNAQRVRSHMARYPGVHLVCFGTPDAAGEHQRLSTHGFEPEPLVRLARTVEDGRTVRFNVVYVPAGKMPEGRVQYCEHLAPEVIWEEPFTSHPNGALGLGDAYIVSEDPPASAARWALFSGLLPHPDDGLVRLDTARGRVFVGTRKALSAFMENVPAAPAVAAFAIATQDPERFASFLEDAGLKVQKTARGRSAALPPGLGGTWLF